MQISRKTRHKRMWHLMPLNASRVIRTLTVYQIQSQVGKTRKKHPECADWRWKAVTLENGYVLVRRVQ